MKKKIQTFNKLKLTLQILTCNLDLTLTRKNVYNTNLLQKDVFCSVWSIWEYNVVLKVVPNLSMEFSEVETNVAKKTD